jgi:hypothetical protein
VGLLGSWDTPVNELRTSRREELLTEARELQCAGRISAARKVLPQAEEMCRGMAFRENVRLLVTGEHALRCSES